MPLMGLEEPQVKYSIMNNEQAARFTTLLAKYVIPVYEEIGRAFGHPMAYELAPAILRESVTSNLSPQNVYTRVFHSSLQVPWDECPHNVHVEWTLYVGVARALAGAILADHAELGGSSPLTGQGEA